MAIDRVIISQLDIDTCPKGFDAEMARKLAALTQQAYKQFDLFKLKNKSPNQQLQNFKLEGLYQLNTEFAEKTVPFGFVASDADSNNNVYVIFRGTRDFVEWFKDVNIRLVSFKDSTDKVDVKDDIANGVVQKNQSSLIIPNIDNDFGFVTAGFRGIYVNLREKLINALNQISQNSPNAKVFVTGHSLGGALATLAIPDILKNTHFTNPNNIELYTFASPRCGDRNFAMSFKKLGVRHWRIANTEDIVTMLPFPTGNVLKPAPFDEPPEKELGIGGVAGVDKNPNPIFGFFKAMYDRNKRRMPDYVHTGTPIYFTIHEAALEKHHNLDEVYMLGILQTTL